MQASRVLHVAADVIIGALLVCWDNLSFEQSGALARETTLLCQVIGC